MSRFILTAEEMRNAEARAIAGGTSVEALMERAGMGAAEAIRRFAGQSEALILCGQGNNGGDGYVIARALRDGGWAVRVAAIGEPMGDAAKAARLGWDGEVEALSHAAPAPLLVDALFGTGLSRPLSAEVAADLARLAQAARVRVAVDLPSGAATDDGRLLSDVPEHDLTVTFQTLKPSHLLQPAARHMGRLVIVDIGVQAESRLHHVARPIQPAPGPEDHKYRRGYVAVLAGDMAGAGALAAASAARSGAGFVRFFAPAFVAGLPHGVVQSPGVEYAGDDRIGAFVIGPGLGLGNRAAEQLASAVAGSTPLVIDADALNLLSRSAFPRFNQVPILTPHAGEFERLFGKLHGGKVEQARAAAAKVGGVIVYKGADTVVAAPDGRAAIASPAPHWLATAGTGDVLAGVVAAMRAAGLEPFDAACAAVWLHGRAAELAGPALIADDLLAQLPTARAECL